MPQSIDTLETPCVLIDIDRADANLKRAQDYADAHGVHLRPHIKTHKLPLFAKRQLELGAIGITCQKLGEAEVMADAGIEDIFLPYNLVGPEKLSRLRALNERTTLAVTADSEFVVNGYASTFADVGKPLTVLVECDTGMGRCGVQTPDDAVALARIIASRNGLVFGGIMTYPAAGAAPAARAWLGEAVEKLSAAGLPPRIVSTGGTPDIWSAHETPIATEYRPGTYIYLDRYQVAKGVGTLEDCALTVLATVVSRPTENRAIIDAGSKALTSDLLGLSGFGVIQGYPDAVISGLSEEHGTIDLSGSAQKPAIGERLRIVPNHACPVSNLYDRVHLVSGDHVVETAAVSARGKVE
ncbi:D-TA family PLP-dependent enzyme [Kaistia dalseonensis]|uniref:D-serine deaminase-like pyridoxal phosphate-dependent protein n=1 Tax=Kaistia dalseonensis TaxID=410840 RepID=A0ABU0H7M5_9HYPH|nr:D-TA family PLP-dependent enzyme [Kaistia dalseonensis]MCX5495307.1 D-TA family PLP-dependent enzyme [Kaistia dalseonensis]MDQ0437893.1 D-serine deaminase-like pyridoxal phosphate-dependent protein [Kaistia dalseonensis]